jgi:hypothetical protein
MQEALEPRARRSAPPPRVRAGHVVALLALAGVLLTVMFFLYHDPHTSQTGDGHQYVRVADHLDRFDAAPFSYRVMAPAIVSASPFTTVLGFQILTVTSLAVTSVLVTGHVLMLYGSRARAGLAWLLFMVSPCVWLSLKDPYSSDPLGYLLIVGAFILIWRQRWMAVAACTTVGIFVRETVAFVALPALVACTAARTNRRLRYAAAIVCLPALAYVLLHYTQLFYRDRRQYDYLSLDTIRAEWTTKSSTSGSGIEALVSAFYRSWGVLWLALPYLLMRAGRLSRWAASSYLLAVVASVLFADSWLRMLAFAFPVMISLTCAIDFTPALATAYLVPYSVLSLVLANQHGSTRKYVVEGVMLLVSGAALGWALLRRKPPAPRLVIEARETGVAASTT